MKNVIKKNQTIPYLLFLMLLSCLPTLAQNGVTVKGTVYDTNGETVIGASIVLKTNNSIGTITDIDGNFTLTVPNENATLLVSFIGMKKQEVKANSQKPLKVTLEDDSRRSRRRRLRTAKESIRRGSHRPDHFQDPRTNGRRHKPRASPHG